jgi:glucose/arabinose dehydrogenase
MRFTLAGSLFLAMAMTVPALAQTPIDSLRIASGFSSPLWIGSPPGDMERLFIVEQNTCDIEIITVGGVAIGKFLDLTGKVNTGANERGLLGMAFDPDYANNGFFYVNYTRSGDAATIVERYTVSANPNIADAGSGLTIFGPIAQPQSNHNGGGLAFGGDGKLYIGMGDGGASNDAGSGHVAGGNAQSGEQILGKLIRINSDGSIPADNPFVGTAGFQDAIWAYGLRNPWRFAFDPDNGNLWIGDVGQFAIEEVDFALGSSTGGENYGWRCMEGFNCTGLSGCTCNAPGLTLPVQTYGHGGGNCSVTGGAVYRGDKIPDFAGRFFYGDYCSGRVWTLLWDGMSVGDQLFHLAEISTAQGGQSVDFITSFGTGGDGEVYIVDQGGEIFRIIPDTAFEGIGSALAGTNGKPILSGEGSMVVGTSGAVHLTNALPSSPAALYIALSEGSAPFKGGVLKPIPILLSLFLGTSATGTIDIPWASWPPGLPPGTPVVFQWAIQDAGGPVGVALSNALMGVQP